jgi:hypothetical protein
MFWTAQKRGVGSSIGLRDSFKVSGDTLGIDLVNTVPPRIQYPHFGSLIFALNWGLPLLRVAAYEWADHGD